jgi:pyruvate dehydrogenase (quinone)
MNVSDFVLQRLADWGIRRVFGYPGDGINGIMGAFNRDDRGVRFIQARHEEMAAFMACGHAKFTGEVGVCLATSGPGAIHLLNGLYDAKKSHAPVLAICGQVPTADIGSDFFQEVDNDVLFSDVSVFCATVTGPDQVPSALEQAVNSALTKRGVAVLSLPGDVGGLDLPRGTKAPTYVGPSAPAAVAPIDVRAVADALNGAGKVTLLVGQGARHARTELLALADLLAAPMVLTLKAKEGLEDDNPFEIGQSGLIGNPATAKAFAACDVLFMVGTDFPYKNFYPSGKVVIQLDRDGSRIGRRTAVDHALVGDTRLTLEALTPLIEAKEHRTHLKVARKAYTTWSALQARLAEPDYERKPVGMLRRKIDNPNRRIRPELLAAAIDRHAAPDAIFTTDTGMSTVWFSRFVRMGSRRRVIGSYNLGSMANAMPQALGAAALDRARQVVSLSGDGGISMLLGDLITAVSHNLPIKIVVFNNGRLGMVKLEMEQVGLAEFGTVLHNPDFAEVAQAIGLAGIRVTEADKVDDAVREAFSLPGPVLLDVVTNPDEIAVPPKPTLEQSWGFAIAKTKEALISPE